MESELMKARSSMSHLNDICRELVEEHQDLYDTVLSRSGRSGKALSQLVSGSIVGQDTIGYRIFTDNLATHFLSATTVTSPTRACQIMGFVTVRFENSSTS